MLILWLRIHKALTYEGKAVTVVPRGTMVCEVRLFNCLLNYIIMRIVLSIVIAIVIALCIIQIIACSYAILTFFFI